MPIKSKAKTTTKKSVKKTTKKVATKKSGKVLNKSSDSQCFWTHDGQILSDLQDLATAFSLMQKSVYIHHVSKERNDFADWVEVVLGDVACAKDLRKARAAKSAHTTVVRHLKSYQI